MNDLVLFFSLLSFFVFHVYLCLCFLTSPFDAFFFLTQIMFFFFPFVCLLLFRLCIIVYVVAWWKIREFIFLLLLIVSVFFFTSELNSFWRSPSFDYYENWFLLFFSVVQWLCVLSILYGKVFSMGVVEEKSWINVPQHSFYLFTLPYLKGLLNEVCKSMLSPMKRVGNYGWFIIIFVGGCIMLYFFMFNMIISCVFSVC